MVSTPNFAALTPNRRTNNGRLFVIVLAAALLVTLPVLPLRLLGLPPLQMPQNISHFFDDILNKSSIKKAAPNQIAAKPQLKTPVAELSAMEVAGQNLLAAIERKPDDPALYNQLGLLYASSAEYDKAVGSFQKAVDSSHLKLAQLTEAEEQSNAKGETDKAAQILLEKSQLNVELSAAHSSLARVYDQLGQHDRVVGQLEQLNTDVVFGSALSQKIAATGASIGAASASSHKLSREVLGLLARAEALIEAKRIPEAINQYKRVLEIDPLAASAHKKLGELALANNNGYLGLHELEIAVRLEPNDATIRNDLGSAYSGEGQPDKAIEQFEKALATAPNNIDAATNLGNLFCAGGQLKPAQQIFEKIAKIKPDSSVAHNNLATIMSMNDDYKGAIGEFEHRIANHARSSQRSLRIRLRILQHQQLQRQHSRVQTCR